MSSCFCGVIIKKYFDTHLIKRYEYDVMWKHPMTKCSVLLTSRRAVVSFWRKIVHNTG